jgi:hypothetical protein
MTDPYVPLGSLFEPIVKAFKDELIAMDVFDKVSEGEDLYTEGLTEVWVVPGRDRIESGGMHMLRHFAEMNVIIFNSEREKVKQPDLRAVAEQAYDKLMEDITHGGTCHWALPTLFHPGYMQVGSLLTIGVIIQFMCNFEQFYPLPTS